MTKPLITKHSASPQIADSAPGDNSSKTATETRKALAFDQNRRREIRQARFRPGPHEQPMCQKPRCYQRTHFRHPRFHSIEFHTWSCYLEYCERKGFNP